MKEEQEFEWDEGNVRHLARHDVAPRDAENAILDPDAIMVEIQYGDEERVKSVGRTNAGRIIVVVFAFRGAAIRAITAYDAPVRIQRLYLDSKHL